MHLLGSGYEPHVSEEGGKLIYSIPVDSSFVSLNFEFEISRDAFEIIKNDAYRYAVLYFSLHTLLQNTIGPQFANQPKPANLQQADFELLVSQVLPVTKNDLEKFIQNFNQDHHISLDFFIQDYLKRKDASR